MRTGRRGFDVTRSPAAAGLGILGRAVTVLEDGQTFGDWQLAAGHFVPAKMAPIAVCPRPDTETQAYCRYRRAPSDIPWSIPVAIRGGAWPFLYEIVNNDGATGLTIGQTLPDNWVVNGLGSYGILSWASPVIGTYTIQLRVTDQDLTEVPIEFTLEVIDKTNTTYFLFVDSASGSDANSGSYSSPFQTMNGWYLSNKNNSTHSTKQVFYRAGTYFVNAITPLNAGQADFASSKPKVHVAYPGETVIIDGGTAYIDVESGAGDLCFQEFRFQHPETTDPGPLIRKQFIRTSSTAAARGIFHNLYFDGNGQSDSGSNSSCIMFTGGVNGTYTSVTRCTFHNCDGLDFVLYYNVFDNVTEGNLITGTYASAPNGNGDPGDLQDIWGFFVKGGADGDARITVRANRVQGATIDRPCWYTSEFTGQLKGNLEVCWNSFKNTNTAIVNEDAGAVAIGQGSGSSTSNYGAIWVYRNNLHNPHISLINIDAGGPFVFQHNAIHHSGTYTKGFYIFDSVALPAALDNDDEVANGTNILDSTTNLLTGAARGLYLGTDGAEVA